MTTGTPRAAAIWPGPLSMPTKSAAAPISAAFSRRPSTPGGRGGVKPARPNGCSDVLRVRDIVGPADDGDVHAEPPGDPRDEVGGAVERPLPPPRREGRHRQ